MTNIDQSQFRSNNLARGRSQYPALESVTLSQTGAVDPAYPPVVRSIYHTHWARYHKHLHNSDLSNIRVYTNHSIADNGSATVSQN